MSGLHAVRETFFDAHKCALTGLAERGLFLIQKVRAKERAPKESPQMRAECLALEQAKPRLRDRGRSRGYG